MVSAKTILHLVTHPSELRSIIQWTTWHNPVHERDESKAEVMRLRGALNRMQERLRDSEAGCQRAMIAAEEAHANTARFEELNRQLQGNANASEATIEHLRAEVTEQTKQRRKMEKKVRFT